MARIFDTHAHYYDKKFSRLEGGAEALLSSREFLDTVCGVVNVGTNFENSIVCMEEAQKYPFMYAAVGIHPSDAQDGSICKLPPDEEIERITSLVSDGAKRRERKIVAIGEIGFDYYWQPMDKKLQYEYFNKQMLLARKTGMPVIIHDRDAHGDTVDMILRYPDVIGVLHSCSMSAESVREVVKRGYYISFSGTVTFKNAERVRETCAAVPLDKLLIETDAPYLTPLPHSRGEINNSIYMKHTAETVANVHGLSFDEIAELTAQNARRLFCIDDLGN